MINYHNKTFRSTGTTGSGDVSAETVFIYRQDDQIVTASYAGGVVVSGHMIGIVDDKGNLDISYHHVTEDGKLKTGKCFSTPEVLKNGKILLHEKWEWTSGDTGKGESVLEEI